MQPTREFQRTQIKKMIVNDEEIRLDTLGCLNCAPPPGNGEDFTLELKLQCHVQKREKFRIVCNHQDRWDSHLDCSYGHEFTLGHRSPPSIQNTLETLSGTILMDRHWHWKCRVSQC